MSIPKDLYSSCNSLIYFPTSFHVQPVLLGVLHIGTLRIGCLVYPYLILQYQRIN